MVTEIFITVFHSINSLCQSLWHELIAKKMFAMYILHTVLHVYFNIAITKPKQFTSIALKTARLKWYQNSTV